MLTVTHHVRSGVFGTSFAIALLATGACSGDDEDRQESRRNEECAACVEGCDRAYELREAECRILDDWLELACLEGALKTLDSCVADCSANECQ